MIKKISVPAFLGALTVAVVPAFYPQQAQAISLEADAGLTVDPIAVQTPILDPVLDPVVDPSLEPVLEPVVDPVLDPVVSGLVSLDRELVDFGDVSVDASGTSVPVTITNDSTTPLEITDIGLSGPNAGDFKLDPLPSLPLTLAPGESVALPGVIFAPVEGGAREAIMEVTTSAGTVLVNLAGNATEAPQATPTPTPTPTPGTSPAPAPTPGTSPTPNTAPKVSPLGSKTTRDRTPLIKARVTDAQTDLRKSNIALFVDGKRKTKFAYNVKRDELRYQSPKLKPGKHKVKIVARDAQGAKTTKNYTITVK